MSFFVGWFCLFAVVFFKFFYLFIAYFRLLVSSNRKITKRTRTPEKKKAPRIGGRHRMEAVSFPLRTLFRPLLISLGQLLVSKFPTVNINWNYSAFFIYLFFLLRTGSTNPFSPKFPGDFPRLERLRLTLTANSKGRSDHVNTISPHLLFIVGRF